LNEDGSIFVWRSSFPKDVHQVITLLDVAGHEKYFKNTIQAMSQGMIDYALVLVNAKQEPNQMTVHHLNLASSLGIPIIIAMTKVRANEA
jgi:GTPase